MKPLKDFFHYTRSERNGAIILLLICLLLVVTPRVFSLFSPSASIDFEEEERLAEQLSQPAQEDGDTHAPAQLFQFDPNTATQEELQKLGLRERVAKAIVNYRSKGGQFRKNEDLKKIYTLAEEDYLRLEPFIRIAGGSSYNDKDFSDEKKQPKTYTLFPFDPNTATQEELLSLGLPKGVATVMLRFREKGGKYRRKEDLRKIYILDEADYLRVEPYITIAGEAGSIPVVSLDIPKQYDAEKNISIDINKANAEEWQQLRGVGPAFAGRITRFREALGGFASVEQVAETRGLPDSTFQKIRLQLRPSPVLRLMDINAADAETMDKHPYIDRRTAEAIVSYRQQHGPFRSADDLRKVYALPEGWVEKMKPYLEFGK